VELILLALWVVSYALAGAVQRFAQAAKQAFGNGKAAAGAKVQEWRKPDSHPAKQVAGDTVAFFGGLLGGALGMLTDGVIALGQGFTSGAKKGKENAPHSLDEAKKRLRGKKPWGEPEPPADPATTDDPPADPPARCAAGCGAEVEGEGMVCHDCATRAVPDPPTYTNGQPAGVPLGDAWGLVDLDTLGGAPFPPNGTPPGGTPMSNTPTGEANSISAARAQLAQFHAAATVYQDSADAAESNATKESREVAGLVAAADQLEAGMRGGDVDPATLGEVAGIKDAAPRCSRAAEA
jgi:hypothetical protein